MISRSSGERLDEAQRGAVRRNFMSYSGGQTPDRVGELVKSYLLGHSGWRYVVRPEVAREFLEEWAEECRRLSVVSEVMGT